jgi:hypothetical protein
MSRVDKSPEQWNAEASGTLTCRTCDGPYLEESPHRHETPPRPDYTVMGLIPAALDCGAVNHGPLRLADQYGSLHLTWCCLRGESRAAYAASLPHRIHVRQVPSDAVPVGISAYSLEAAGYVLTAAAEDLLDAGIGVPFHPEFTAHLEAPRELMPRKMREYRNHCSAKHTSYADHGGTAMCDTLLRAMVCGGSSVDGIARTHAMTPERVTSHLTIALQTIYRWRSQAMNDLAGHRVKRETAA